MEGFKNHYIDWKQWDRSANMKHKIHKFTRDWKENRVLNKILDYNKWKYREKLVLRRTSKYELLKLLWAKWASDIVKTKIENILNLSSRPKKRVWRNIEIKWRWIKKLLNFIAIAEWTNNSYNIRFWHKKTPNLSKMTINQVIAYQNRLKWHTAIWRYQIKKSTLKMLRKFFGWNNRMTPGMQDKMAVKLLELRWLNSYKRWRLFENRFINRLAHEWASLPMTNWKSAYQWDKAWNHSRVKIREFRRLIRWLKY